MCFSQPGCEKLLNKRCISIGPSSTIPNSAAKRYSDKEKISREPREPLALAVGKCVSEYSDERERDAGYREQN